MIKKRRNEIISKRVRDVFFTSIEKRDASTFLEPPWIFTICYNLLQFAIIYSLFWCKLMCYVANWWIESIKLMRFCGFLRRFFLVYKDWLVWIATLRSCVALFHYSLFIYLLLSILIDTRHEYHSLQCSSIIAGLTLNIALAFERIELQRIYSITAFNCCYYCWLMAIFIFYTDKTKTRTNEFHLKIQRKKHVLQLQTTYKIGATLDAIFCSMCNFSD